MHIYYVILIDSYLHNWKLMKLTCWCAHMRHTYPLPQVTALKVSFDINNFKCLLKIYD